MNASQNLGLLRELIRCGGEISLWQYGGEGNLLSSNICRDHRCRSGPAQPEAVQKCCSCIEMNLGERI